MLNRLVYFVFMPFLYLLSILPFWVLYRISDLANLIGYRIAGYRVSLVKANLKKTFPDKTEKEIKSIMNAFYQHFFDLIFESIKVLTISKKQILKRVELGDVKAFEHYNKIGQSVIIATGHFGNWELGAARYAIADFPRLIGVYKPLSNPFFNQLMKKVRTRFGGDVYAMEETLERMRKDKDKLTAVTLLADQNPSSHNAYWYRLLGRETPVFTGVELLSKRFNYPVIYSKLVRLSRGRYRINCEVLVDNPSDTAKYEITHEYIHRIERDILARPEDWLWTHNRWKRKKSA